MERHGVRALQALNNNGGVVRHVILREVAQATRLMCALLRSPLFGVRGDGTLSGLKRRPRPLPHSCGVATQIPASSDSVAAVLAAVGCRHNFAASPPGSPWPACDRIAVLRLAIIDTSNPARVAGGGQPAFHQGRGPDICIVTWPLSEKPRQVCRWVSGHESISADAKSPTFLCFTCTVAEDDPPSQSRLTALAALQLRRRRVLPWADLLYVHSPELVLPFAGQAWAPPVVLHIHGNAHPLAQSRYPWARSGLSRHIYTRIGWQRSVGCAAVDRRRRRWCSACDRACGSRRLQQVRAGANLLRRDRLQRGDKGVRASVQRTTNPRRLRCAS